MFLMNLVISNFRNYQNAEVDLSPSFNVIRGLNAQGKTNFLESIYLICLGRSFRAAKNQDLLRSDSESFHVKAVICHDNGIDRKVVVSYVRDGRKEISIDRKRVTSHSKIFGEFPVVIMAPDEFKVTAGRPSERRRFLDILLSQISLSYLSNLQEYTKILKQRNSILQRIKEGTKISDSVIEPWTDRLVETGAVVFNYRLAFLKEFSKIVNKCYQQLSQTQDVVDISIESTIYNNEGNSIQTFKDRIKEKRAKEFALGTTVVGPHRDDLVFTINEMDLRKYGSRGEHKSMLVALKLAEFRHLRDKKNETPVLLLDDCHSELDNNREQGVLDILDGVGQVFMTSPREEFMMDNTSLKSNQISKFTVSEGVISSVSN